MDFGKDFFYGIDGTGPGNECKYQQMFANSFVRQTYEQFGRNSYYTRGPEAEGFQTKKRGAVAYEEAMRHVSKANHTNKVVGTEWDRPRIFLGGFSRGGAAVIHTCNLLEKEGVEVSGLFLFDAVDRTLFLHNVQTIPANVSHAWHALRSSKANSRPEFGNCGLKKAERQGGGAAPLYTKEFYTTHGGVGGVRFGTTGMYDPLSDKIREPHAIRGMHVAAPSETNVDALQELSGSSAAGFWMKEKLKFCRIVA